MTKTGLHSPLGCAWLSAPKAAQSELALAALPFALKLLWQPHGVVLKGVVHDRCHAAQLNSVTTLAKALVDILASFTLNLAPGVLVAASLVSPTSNFCTPGSHPQVCSVETCCLSGKMSADASITAPQLLSQRASAIQTVVGVPVMGLAPGFSHVSHTPKRSVVEADFTLPKCCPRSNSYIRSKSLVAMVLQTSLASKGLHTHPTDLFEA